MADDDTFREGWLFGGYDPPVQGNPISLRRHFQRGRDAVPVTRLRGNIGTL